MTIGNTNKSYLTADIESSINSMEVPNYLKPLFLLPKYARNFVGSVT